MRRDRLYLLDIVEAAEAIERFLAGISESEFLGEELYQAAVLQKLSVIGEAAARLSKDLRGEQAHIDWQDIVGFRNIAVHQYFAVNWEIVWITATRDAPLLKDQVEKILAESFPKESAPDG